ncbi:MAG: hypothetical protein K2M34_02665 [Alphaproteobacteria bacterium]|nr:hypothetical protein [Alphaproteobacteria bacterium]
MSNKELKSKFIYPFGPKISGCDEFSPEMDTTDQRSPVTTVQDAFQMFTPNDEIMDELESESLDDFDGDITDYDYDDRGEFGEDIAMSQRAEFAALGERLASRKKQRSRR